MHLAINSVLQLTSMLWDLSFSLTYFWEFKSFDLVSLSELLLTWFLLGTIVHGNQRHYIPSKRWESLPKDRASDLQNHTFTYFFPFVKIKRNFVVKLREMYSRVNVAKSLLFMVTAITSVMKFKQHLKEYSWNSLILIVGYTLFCQVMT